MPPASPETEFCPRGCVSGGFTLLELLWTLAALGILLSAGIPALSGMVQRYASEADMGNLRSALSFARSEAIVRKSRVVVCPRQFVGSTQCYSGSLGGNTATAEIWKRGFLVFIDRSRNGSSNTSIDSADGDLLLKAFDSMDNDAWLLVRGNNVGGQLGFVAFNSRGESNPVSSSFLLCLAGGGESRRFADRIVLNVGRLRQASRAEAEEECDAAGQ